MSTVAPSVRLAQVSVTKLFGIFNHNVRLRTKDHITIIYGLNGFGKTIILRMIHSLMNGRMAIFDEVPFSTFRVEFTDNSSIEVSKDALAAYPDRHVRNKRKSSSKVPNTSATRISITLADGTPIGPLSSSAFEAKTLTSEILQEWDRYIPPPYFRAGDGWVNRETEETLSIEQIAGMFRSRIPKQYTEEILSSSDPPLAELRDRLKVRLIRTQRLAVERIERPASSWMRDNIWIETSSDREPELTVDIYSEDIAQRFQRILAQYGNRSQDRDRTFPRRLIYLEEPILERNVLLARFESIEARRAELIALGFLGKEQEGLSQPPEEALARKADVLTVYVGDIEKKFAVFDDMASRVSLFLELFNKRIKYKTVRIGPSKRFVFESKIGPIAPSDLSSGEQHEMVLLYELLFKIRSGGLVLIDEPEISLHLEWQNEYMSDLIRIVQLSGIDVLLATHSPNLIGDYWSLTEELKGPSVE